MLGRDYTTPLPSLNVDGLLTPVIAVESIRALPTLRAVVGTAKILHVLEGTMVVETADRQYELNPGSAFAIGPDQWCTLTPKDKVRLWTIYIDERLLREQMGWALPIPERAMAGTHPHYWDGSPLCMAPGLDLLSRIEPLWRQLSIIGTKPILPERAAARAVALFALAVEHSIEHFVLTDVAKPSVVMPRLPLVGHLTASPTTLSSTSRAAELLRNRMHEPWTIKLLAREVALSRTHLTRLFSAQIGISPTRFLTEIRLTEFTRLIEETDLPIQAAARSVGWSDSRVASTWFRKRFGQSPTEFRKNPHHSAEAILADSNLPEMRRM